MENILKKKERFYISFFNKESFCKKNLPFF